MIQKDNWWKKFFNQDYYDFWNPALSKKRSVKEVNFIIKLLKLKSGAEILDAPCGQGRHSMIFAKKGFKVVGIDYSKVLLKKANEQCRGILSKPIFLQNDIRKLKYVNKFSAVVNLFTSFGYFNDQDNERVISSFYKALKPGGYLALDLLNKNDILRSYNNNHISEKIFNNIFIRSKIVNFDFYSNIAHIQWSIKKANLQKKLDAYIRLYSYFEIKTLLTKQGFKIKKVFGDYNSSKFTNKSKRMIIIAKRCD